MRPELMQITALQWEPAPWWKTQVEPRGAFPRLQLLHVVGASPNTSLCPPAVFTPRVIGTAVARYNFAARDMRELSLREGDVVKIYSRIGGDQGWWKGETNGRVRELGVPSPVQLVSHLLSTTWSISCADLFLKLACKEINHRMIELLMY